MNILFICGGSFAGLENIIAKRLGQQVIGFRSRDDERSVPREELLRFVEPEDLVKAVRRANIRFFLTPRFILHHIRKYRSPKQFLEALSALWRKLSP